MLIWQLCANLLIPNCLRSNLSYSLLAALELYVNNYTTKISLPNGFEGGKKYTYTIRVHNNSIVIGNASITGWGIGVDNGSLDAEIE